VTTQNTLSEAFYAKADEICARYPVRRSALIMLLHEAQDEIGFVSDDVIVEVGAYMGLSPADVEGVVTFYTMFKRRNPGAYLISVCTNLSCTINGAEDTAKALQDALGDPHELPEGGKCSWEPVECLATCHWAVAAQVNYHDVPFLTPDRATKLVEDLRGGKDLDAVLDQLRKTLPAEPATEESADG
jgi:NADH-quinone oxidoreductase subunit E